MDCLQRFVRSSQVLYPVCNYLFAVILRLRLESKYLNGLEFCFCSLETVKILEDSIAQAKILTVVETEFTK